MKRISLVRQIFTAPHVISCVKVELIAFGLGFFFIGFCVAASLAVHIADTICR